MKRIEEQYEIAFAALLHDIGKFKQRAFGGEEKYLSEETKKMEAYILPSYNGNYTHRHALWTFDFFISDLSKMPKSTVLESLDLERIAKFSSQHHNPEKNTLSEIISIADKASAAMDRVYNEEYKRGEYLNTALKPVFSYISFNHSNISPKSEYGYKLHRLDSERSVFPEKEIQVDKESYKKLYDAFLEALNNAVNAAASVEGFLFKLVDLLHEFTWCIPSATNDYLNDISLYDHSRTTLAIALALFNSETMSMKLCSYGVSGIQSYIFQSKYEVFSNALKIFRGRSFIISVMTTAYKIALCKKLGILPFIDLMDAGGNCIIILPDDTEVDNRVEAFQREVERFLLEKYYGTLCIVLGEGIKARCDDFASGNFINLYREIGKNKANAKTRKFSRAIEGRDSLIDADILGKSVCSACGIRSSDNSDGLCKVCAEEAMLGKNIPSVNLICFDSDFGVEILPDFKISIEKNYSIAKKYVWALNKNYSYPVWRINNYSPENKEFEDIAESAVNANNRGSAFISYVKIDVDSLGKIITEGFAGREFSVSRFATLSRMLNHFFSSYVYAVLEKKYENAYTVLSGGDDLFVIMPWNQALSFIKDLKEQFNKFCAGNGNFHFSSGVVISKPSVPFSVVNEKANIALDDFAKEYPDKNAIYCLDAVFPLNELNQYMQDLDYISSKIKLDDEEGLIPISFVYRLLGYIDILLDENVSNNKKYMQYSQLHYDIARNLIDKNQNNEKVSEFCNYLLNKIINYDNLNELKKFRSMLVYTIYNIRMR